MSVNIPLSEETRIYDLLPESVIKVNKSLKIVFKNQFFKTHFPNVDHLNDLIGKNQKVFLIGTNHEPLKTEDLPEFKAFKTQNEIHNFIVGSNDTLHREVRWLNINCKPIINENNEYDTVISVIKDISSFYINKKRGSINMQMYKDHLEKSGEYIFRIGFYPKKHFLYVSANIHQTFGYHVGEYIDNPNLFIDMIHKDDVHIYQNLLEDKFKKNNRARLRFITRDGSIKWCNISFFPHFYGETNEMERLEGIISNITDFVQQKTDVILKDKIIQGILNKAQVFQYTCLNDEHYTMINLDEDFEKFTGYSVNSILENTKIDFNSLIHFQDREMVHQKINQAISEGRVWDIEYRIKHANGNYIWVKEYGLTHKDNYGKDVLSGIIANIQRTKEGEEKNIQISKNYENIVNNSKLGTWEWNVQSGETHFNQRWAEIIGYTLEELSPVDINTWINHTHPLDLEKSNQELQRHFNGETDLYECEARMKHKSGEWVWVRDTGRVSSWDVNGKPISMSGVHQDITQLKKIELNLKHKLEFEKILANVSKNFISGNISFDLLLDNALEELGSITHASRIYIFQTREGGQIMDNTHEWCAEGVSREIENLQNLPTSIFPWWMDKLNRGEIIQIPDVSKMPKAASAEKEILESQNIKSLIVVGLRIQGELVGFIGFDDVMQTVVEWDKDEQYLLLWMSQIFSNVFENKRSRDQLIKSESKFRNIFEKNPSPQLLIDPLTGDILDANHAALVFYGYSETNLLKKNFIRLSNKNINEKHFKEDLEIIAHNSYVEYQQITSSNKLRKIELFGGKILIDDTEILHIILHDITRQYSIMDRNKILRSAIDGGSIGVFITDIDGNIQDMNQSAMILTGYHLDEIRDKNISILDVDFYTTLHCEKIKDFLIKGKIWQDEILRKRKDGTKYWTNLKLIPVLDTNNQIINIVGLEENIDEKKKQLIALEEAKKAAEESNRLKSSFLSTINHELRTPLNHIIGLSDVIQELSLEESIQEYSSIITKSGMNLLQIIEDILNLAVYDTEDLTARQDEIKLLDLYITLKESLIELHEKSSKSQNIELKFKPLASLMNQKMISDQNKIIMIFNNLFKNALKFTTKGFIEFGMKEIDQNLVFYVKDTGIGIAENKKDIIFDFFRQVDDTDTRKHDGVGIGLTIAQKAAQILNADIIVESEPDKGSVFSVNLNHKIINNVNDHRNDGVKDNIPNFSHKKILVVEDDDDSFLVTKLLLDKTKADFDRADNGKTAVDTVKNEHYDLIIMDLKMPEMDGFEATKLIKESKPEQLIIGLTAYSFMEDKNRALQVGCSDVLSKPVNKFMLYKTLEKYLQ